MLILIRLSKNKFTEEMKLIETQWRTSYDEAREDASETSGSRSSLLIEWLLSSHKLDPSDRLGLGRLSGQMSFPSPQYEAEELTVRLPIGVVRDYVFDNIYIDFRFKGTLLKHDSLYWLRIHDRAMYVHHSTVQRYVHTTKEKQVEPGPTTNEFPPGIEEHTTDLGVLFYADHNSHKTYWEVPRLAQLQRLSTPESQEESLMRQINETPSRYDPDPAPAYPRAPEQPTSASRPEPAWQRRRLRQLQQPHLEFS